MQNGLRPGERRQQLCKDAQKNLFVIAEASILLLYLTLTIEILAVCVTYG